MNWGSSPSRRLFISGGHFASTFACALLGFMAGVNTDRVPLAAVSSAGVIGVNVWIANLYWSRRRSEGDRHGQSTGVQVVADAVQVNGPE